MDPARPRSLSSCLWEVFKYRFHDFRVVGVFGSDVQIQNGVADARWNDADCVVGFQSGQNFIFWLGVAPVLFGRFAVCFCRNDPMGFRQFIHEFVQKSRGLFGVI